MLAGRLGGSQVQSGFEGECHSLGFFLGEQNRALLIHEDGRLTERAQAILEHTPARRFGEPEELVGTLNSLCSPAARFVTGVVVPVDGGFGAFGGV